MTIQFSEQTVNATISGTVRDFAISPDGAYILVCTSVDTYLLQWDSANNRWNSVTISGKSAVEPGTAPGFSLDSTYCYFQKNANLDQSASNAFIRWQLVSGTWTETRNSASSTRMKSFKPGLNNQMIALYYDQLYIWTNVQATNGTDIGPFFTGASASIPNDAAWSPDGEHFVITARNTAVRVWRRTGTTTYSADTISGATTSTGNWRAQWIDNTHFLLSESEVSTGLYLGTLTSTNTWTITQIDSTFNSTASFILNDGKLAGYFNSSAAALPKLFDFSTGSMVATTDFAGLPSTQIMIAARSRQTGGGNKILALAPSTGGMRVFALLNAATVPIVYPTFGIAATGEAQDGVVGALAYQTFAYAGNLNVPIGLTGAYTHVGFTFAGVAGAFPPEYPENLQLYLSAISGVEGNNVAPSFEDAGTFWYANAVYPNFAIDPDILLTIPTATVLTYPKMEIYGTMGTIESETEIVYAKFGVEVVCFDFNEVEASYSYPFFESHDVLKLDYYVNGDVVFPRFAVAGTVEFVIANAAFSYPAFDVDSVVSATSTRGVFLYPLFAADGEINVPVGINGAIGYAKTAMAGQIDVPVAITTGYAYPKLTMEGVIGVLNLVENDNVYPKFRIAANIGYTMSVDASVIYAKFQIAANGAPPPNAEGDLLYPKFGTAFVVDNYYGASMDAEITIDMEGEGETLKQRKSLLVLEH